jgi:outer membrane protein assembly factor BamD
MMTKAEALEAKGKLKEAIVEYRVLIKKTAESVLAPKAQRKIGILLEKQGNLDPAYKAYETYLAKYTRGEDIEAVAESMFKIAKLYLDGKKQKVLGVPLGEAQGRAQTMFEGIVKKAPFSKWAPVAQFNVGQSLEKQGKLPEAIAAYQQVIARYAGDRVAEDALYQIGYVRMRDYREGNDRNSALKARESFEDFTNRYPESEKAAQAKENLKTLAGGQAKSTLDIAKFYDKSKQYKAAVIYYNDVIKEQPGTPSSELAKNRIEALKAQVGEDVLHAGPERAENGARVEARRKLEAKVDTASRPDYAGPPVKIAEQKVQTATPSTPPLRGSFGPVPAVEPALPGSKPESLPQDTGLPVPPPPSLGAPMPSLGLPLSPPPATPPPDALPK